MEFGVFERGKRRLSRGDIERKNTGHFKKR
jgi:hypothetical protein